MAHNCNANESVIMPSIIFFFYTSITITNTVPRKETFDNHLQVAVKCIYVNNVHKSNDVMLLLGCITEQIKEDANVATES